MKTGSRWAWILVALFVVCTGTAFGQNHHRLGGGVNYWVALNDIELDEFDDNGLSYFASYQYWPSLFGFELLGEIRPDGFGSETVYAPQAFLLVGQAIYAGIGAGINYVDSEWADDPFFALKAGLNLELVPSIYLDLSAQYRFSDFDQVGFGEGEIDTDSLFLGAAIRFGF
jgi:hypothetical protein